MSCSFCGARKAKDNVNLSRFPQVNNRNADLTVMSKRRQSAWLIALGKDGTDPHLLRNYRVCSRHFISGRSARLKDTNDVDWVPTLNMGYEKGDDSVLTISKAGDEDSSSPCEDSSPQLKIVPTTSKASDAFYEEDSSSQLKRKPISKVSSLCEGSSSDRLKSVTTTSKDITSTPTGRLCEGSADEKEELELDQDNVIFDDPIDESILDPKGIARIHHAIATQTDSKITCLSESILLSYKEKIVLLEEMLAVHTIKIENFANNDAKTRFFTGITSFNTMREVYLVVEEFLPHSPKPTKFQIFYIVLTRLRLNLSFRYLGYKFSVSVQTISKYFHEGLFVLYSKLRSLVYWPSRDSIKKTMPTAFQRRFGKRITIIIDCFDIFIEKASKLKAQAQTFSQYKHAHTLKYSVGITPQGMISYISETYGGRSSDKFVTETCGFLENIEEDDVVMADRGFLIENALKEKLAHINIPVFTKGKDKLHPLELESTRDTANVRIHVERIIGQLRAKFTILAQRKFPMHSLCRISNKCNVAVVDQILSLCCALSNLCSPICVKEMEEE